MKYRWLVMSILAGLTLPIMFFILSRAEATDVVNHQFPVSNLYGNIRNDLAVMASLPADRRADYLRRQWPNLEEGVVNFLRQRGKIRHQQEVRSVDFHFGSLKDVRAEGGDGQTREGYFKDQVI